MCMSCGSKTEQVWQSCIDFQWMIRKRLLTRWSRMRSRIATVIVTHESGLRLTVHILSARCMIDHRSVVDRLLFHARVVLSSWSKCPYLLHKKCVLFGRSFFSDENMEVRSKKLKLRQTPTSFFELSECIRIRLNFYTYLFIVIYAYSAVNGKLCVMLWPTLRMQVWVSTEYYPSMSIDWKQSEEISSENLVLRITNKHCSF